MGCCSNKRTDSNKTSQQDKNDPNVEKAELIKNKAPANKNAPITKDAPLKNELPPKNDNLHTKGDTCQNNVIKNDPAKKNVKSKKVHQKNLKNECVQTIVDNPEEEKNNENALLEGFKNQMDVVSKFANRDPQITQSKVKFLHEYTTYKFYGDRYNPVMNQA